MYVYRVLGEIPAFPAASDSVLLSARATSAAVFFWLFAIVSSPSYSMRPAPATVKPKQDGKNRQKAEESGHAP